MRKQLLIQEYFVTIHRFFHHGFHLCGLQAGNESVNEKAFVAEGEKGGGMGQGPI